MSQEDILMAQNTVITTLAAMVQQHGPIMFNNPDDAPYTAYQVGDALGFITEGWTLKEVKGDWVNLVCEGQPDRAIHIDGRVRVRVSEKVWRKSRKEVCVVAIDAGSTTLVVGETYPIKEVFKSYGATFYKDLALTEYGDAPVSGWELPSPLPQPVAELLYGPRPGVWQCVADMLQKKPLWLSGDHLNIAGIASGFCARTGHKDFSKSLGTRPEAATKKLAAHRELWNAFMPVEDEPEAVVVVEEVKEPVAKKPRSKANSKKTTRNAAVVAVEKLAKCALPEHVQKLVMEVSTRLGISTEEVSNKDALTVLLDMQNLLVTKSLRL